MTPTPWICLFACSLALPVAAQPRADRPPSTSCSNLGATVTCAHVTPVSAEEALRILTASIAPFSAPVEEAMPPYAPPEGTTYIGRVDGPVFSDYWPYDSAGIYEPRLLTPDRRGAHLRHDASPRIYRDVRRAYDPLTGRWYR